MKWMLLNIYFSYIGIHKILVIIFILQYIPSWLLSQKSKEIPGDQATEGINRKLTVLIGELMPGELYHFQFYTTAHGVTSNTTKLTSRTR